jgi:hypothetical protein
MDIFPNILHHRQVLIELFEGLLDVLWGFLHSVEKSFLIHKIVKKRQEGYGGDVGLRLIESLANGFLIHLNLSACRGKFDFQKGLIFVAHGFFHLCLFFRHLSNRFICLHIFDLSKYISSVFVEKTTKG